MSSTAQYKLFPNTLWFKTILYYWPFLKNISGYMRVPILTNVPLSTHVIGSWISNSFSSWSLFFLKVTNKSGAQYAILIINELRPAYTIDFKFSKELYSADTVPTIFVRRLLTYFFLKFSKCYLSSSNSSSLDLT